MRPSRDLGRMGAPSGRTWADGVCCSLNDKAIFQDVFSRPSYARIPRRGASTGKGERVFEKGGLAFESGMNPRRPLAEAGRIAKTQTDFDLITYS
jgi:hypothetical protein